MHISPVSQNIYFNGIVPKRFTKRKNEPEIPKYDECYDPKLKGLRVRVPVFGYRSFSDPKSIVINDRYKEVVIQGGRAYCPEDKEDYSGLVVLKDKKNELIGLEFSKGELVSSYVGKKQYKIYSDLPFQEALKDENFNFSHKFQDGTELEEEQFYGMQDVVYKKITTMKKGTPSVTYIKRNNAPIYYGEPFLRVVTNEKSVALLNSEGVKKIEFKTLSEAEEYFDKEYGIKASFINLKQAHLVKNAIDEFAKLNYKGKGKRLFEGLHIGKFQGNPKEQGQFSVLFFPLRPNIESEVNLDEMDEDFFADHIEVITFNKDYNWNVIEQSERYCYKIGFHPDSKATNPIMHEFAHCLHLISSPKKFYFCAENKPTEEELPVVQSVSKYAVNNIGEFVAEYIAGRMSGKKYSEEVDDLYKKYANEDLIAYFEGVA